MAHHSDRHAGYWIIVDTRNNNNSHTKLGITASKRYGRAHERNRFKRLVREAFRLCRQQLIPSLDINVRPRSAAKNAGMADILHELIKLIGKR